MRNAITIQKIIRPLHYFSLFSKGKPQNDTPAYLVEECIPAVIPSEHVNIGNRLIAAAGNPAEIRRFGPRPRRKRKRRRRLHLFANIRRSKSPGRKAHIRDIKRSTLCRMFPISPYRIGIIEVIANTRSISSAEYVIIGFTGKIIRSGIVLVFVIREEKSSFPRRYRCTCTTDQSHIGNSCPSFSVIGPDMSAVRIVGTTSAEEIHLRCSVRSITVCNRIAVSRNRESSLDRLSYLINTLFINSMAVTR